MRTVVHLPSWYPNKNNDVAGIFCKKLIEAIANTDPNHYQHIVITWHSSKFASLKQPLTFLRTIIHYFFSPKISERQTGNLKHVHLNVFQSHESMFGKNDKRIINAISTYLNKRQTFDIIHAQVAYIGGHVAKKVSEPLEKDYIITEHMGELAYQQFAPVKQSKINNALSSASLVATVSSYQQKFLRKNTDFEGKIIPNVVSELEFNHCINENKIINNCFTFITIGLLSPVKGIHTLLDALKIVVEDSNVHIKLKICGQGPIFDELIAYSLKINVNDNVEWLGKVPREIVLEQLLSSNCYVCSSTKESFGVALIEAMACGLPIVSTNCGGPTDFINSTTGLLAEGIDASSLAEKMLEIISSIDKFEPRRSRQYYLDNYSNKVIGEQYLQEYDKLISQKTN